LNSWAEYHNKPGKQGKPPVTTKTFEIQVHDDHLARLATVRKPILAVAELI
jgi:hypothetical protein